MRLRFQGIYLHNNLYSETGDDFWDCSSNDGDGDDDDGASTDSDGDLEHNKFKYACMEKISKRFSAVFGGSLNLKTKAVTREVSSNIADEGMQNIIKKSIKQFRNFIIVI